MTKKPSGKTIGQAKSSKRGSSPRVSKGVKNSRHPIHSHLRWGNLIFISSPPAGTSVSTTNWVRTSSRMKAQKVSHLLSGRQVRRR